MFEWSADEKALRKEATTFAKSLNEGYAQREATGTFHAEGWRQAGALGYLGLGLPEAYGGSGADIRTTVAVMEALGHGCEDNGLLFSMGAHIWACEMPLLAFGTDAQKERWLPGMIDGSCIGAHAISEPDAGSDTNAMRATATKDSDGYVINGNKLFVTNGPVASLLIVFAKLTVDGVEKGITAFLVEKGTQGLTFTNEKVAKMGMRTSPMGEFVLEDCRVPHKNRLGPEGSGSSIFNHGMEWERGFILAPVVGTMRRILAQTVKYMRQRRQFDQPLARFQMVANRVVDMRLKLESAEAALAKVTAIKARGKMAVEAAALAKLTISEAWVDVCSEAMALHGGYGYLSEFGLESQMRDALGSRAYSGASDIQRLIVARFMGL